VTGPELRAVGTSAGFGRRFAALIYDGLLMLAVLMLYTLVVTLVHGKAVLEADDAARWWAYRAGEFLLIGAYCVVNWTRSGQTLGMRAWRLHAVSDTGKRLDAPRAAWRFVWAVVAWTPAALGVLWLYADPERLALHDRLSGTRMLHVPRAAVSASSKSQ
jgi:uncharacterized RDD family membrane protein YckC